jgi:hypothetical protein
VACEAGLKARSSTGPRWARFGTQSCALIREPNRKSSDSIVSPESEMFCANFVLALIAPR